MAKRISDLPEASILGLDDRIPVVQGGITKRARGADLLAGIQVTQAQYDAIAAQVLAATLTPRLGTRYRITDGALAGRVFEWNGESFGGSGVMPLHQRFAQMARSSQNVAGDATMATIESITIPGYLMGRNSKLRITTDWAFTPVGGTKILSIYFGGSAIGAPSFGTAGQQTAKILTEIVCVNSFLSQRVYNSTSYGVISNPLLVRDADVRAPVTIDFSCRWGAAVAGETITLVGYTVELIP